MNPLALLAMIESALSGLEPVASSILSTLEAHHVASQHVATATEYLTKAKAVLAAAAPAAQAVAEAVVPVETAAQS